MEWKEIKNEKPEIGDYIIIYGKIDEILCILTTVTYKGTLSETVTHWTLLNHRI